MAKKAVKTERQQVIEQIRKKQKGDERRRGLVIVGVCVVVAVLIVGGAAFKPVKGWWDSRKYDSKTLSEIGAPASVCQEVTTKKATGNQQHVPTGSPVDYKDAPPAFGKHWNQAGLAPAPIDRKLYTASDRPPLEALVHNLEHGYTILWYDSTIADDGEAMDELNAFADKLGSDTNFRDKFIAAPWTSADENGKTFPSGQHVALTHWSVGGPGNSDPSAQVGVWQYCSDVSGAALDTFMKDYPYTDSPEPTVM